MRTSPVNASSKKKNTLMYEIKKDLFRYWSLYLMFIPVLAYYLIFHYYPMYGAQIAFRDFSPKHGITGSPWVGLKHINSFFNSIFAFRLIRNTFLINFYDLIFGFPAPIILALMINEVRNKIFKRTVQTVSYLPHFISTVVVAGMVLSFTSTDGIITNILTLFGFPKQNLLMDASNFRTIYVASGIWQGVGWGSIIYIAALSGINQELYEAAKIDGAGRWKQTLHVTLPGITPTIITMLILRVGTMMSLGHEKVMLLYNPGIYETADVISTYVYRKGLIDMSYSYSAAVGLFNSVVNLVLLWGANKISRSLTETSLW